MELPKSMELFFVHLLAEATQLRREALWIFVVLSLATTLWFIIRFMAQVIQQRQKTKLLRLISARADVDYAMRAYKRIKAARSDEDRYDNFLSFVVSYYRPFTENSGIGNLTVEFPNYPQELGLDQADMRHQRMKNLRNKFLSHSSLEGTKVVLLAPGATDPGTGSTVSNYSWNVGKREFLDQRYADWLVEIVEALRSKLDELIDSLVQELGKKVLDPGEARLIDTPVDNFRWT